MLGGRYGERVCSRMNIESANVAADERASIDALLCTHGLAPEKALSQLRRNSIACVTLPTCGLAMAESERYLPSLIDKLGRVLADHGLRNEPIMIRMSGCPNGCSRPYIAEVGFTGRATGNIQRLSLAGAFTVSG